MESHIGPLWVGEGLNNSPMALNLPVVKASLKQDGGHRDATLHQQIMKPLISQATNGTHKQPTARNEAPDQPSKPVICDALNFKRTGSHDG